MPAAHRLGDNDTGHDACPPTALSFASGDVYSSTARAQGAWGTPTRRTGARRTHRMRGPSPAGAALSSSMGAPLLV